MARIIIEDIGLEEAIENFRALLSGRAHPPPAAFQPQEQQTDIFTVLMTKPVHRAVLDRMVWRGREDAGILLGPQDHHLVTSFVPDDAGSGSAAHFKLGARALNRVLKQYVPLGYDAKGVIHMHPPGCGPLSPQDLSYAQRLLGNPKNAADRLLMPLVCDGRILPYIVFPSEPDTAREGQLLLI